MISSRAHHRSYWAGPVFTWCMVNEPEVRDGAVRARRLGDCASGTASRVRRDVAERANAGAMLWNRRVKESLSIKMSKCWSIAGSALGENKHALRSDGAERPAKREWRIRRWKGIGGAQLQTLMNSQSQKIAHPQRIGVRNVNQAPRKEKAWSYNLIYPPSYLAGRKT